MTAPHHKSFEEREASFWKQIEDKYGSRAGFENFVFKSYRHKSTVHCDKHGALQLDPHRLLQTNKKHFCRKCSYKELSVTLAERDFEKRREEFKQRVIDTFGSYEGFEDFVFVNSLTKGIVHCKKHGNYEKCPAHIFKDKHPCSKCSKELREQKSVENFVEKFNNIYGDSLILPSLTYKCITSNKLVEVECPLHGKFKRTGGNLLIGIGCNECEGRKPAAYTTESFKRRVASVRGTDKGLESVVWSGHDQNVMITCEKHGTVPCYPSTLLAGGWCEQCSIDNRTKWDTASLIEASKERFPGKLLYDKTVYEHWQKPMTFYCAEHGDFEAVLDTHLRSTHGCPMCAERGGYNANYPGYLYILKSSKLTKIGITNKTPEHRLRNINKTAKDFELVDSYLFQDGRIPKKLETLLLREYRSTHRQPTEVFDGYTECFYDVDLDTLISRIIEKSDQLVLELSIAAEDSIQT